MSNIVTNWSATTMAPLGRENDASTSGNLLAHTYNYASDTTSQLCLIVKISSAS